jgi:MarR family 2-MHQ and catechol resistance regulon transcriptional repressor
MKLFRPAGSRRGRALQLMQALRDLARQSQQLDRRYLAGSELSPAQWHCMEELWRRGPQPMGELAERLAIARSSATRLVDPLEKKGFLKRKTSADDGRSQTVDLSRLGEQLVADLLGEAEAAYDRLYRSLRAEERDVWLAAAHSLAESQRLLLERDS